MPDASEPDAPDEPSAALDAADGELVSDELSGESRRIIAARGEFSGPLPHPNMLGEYDQVQPGLGKIIVEQWQAETRHRHETIDGLRQLDQDAMHAYYSGEKRGQWLGFAAFAIIASVAVVAILMHSVEAALGSIFVAAAYAVSAFRRRSTQPSADVEGDALDLGPSTPPPSD